MRNFPLPKWDTRGLGSAAQGGKPSTADGGRFALGNTEEDLRYKNLGVAAIGQPSDGPLDRRTGRGWVAATTAHDYADAQRRGNPVTLLASESTGALAADFARALRALGKTSRLPTTHDSTQYGQSRASPSTFAAHHIAAISSAIVHANILPVLNAAAHMSFLLSMGLTP